MNDKLFVALTFRTDSMLSHKIDGFRQRFDPKYQQYSFFHMAMLAPFEVKSQNTNVLADHLKEELDTFFFGEDSPLKLSFTGADVLNVKKKYLLHLNPKYSVDIEHCMELVLDICKSFVPKGVRYKPNKKQFLPLGWFHDEDSLEMAVSHLKELFETSSELTISGISLFRKKHGIWAEEEKLISFEETEDKFLQYHIA